MASQQARPTAVTADEARDELERAQAAYESVRFGRGTRAAEWEAARRLDAARAAYVRAGGAVLPTLGARPRRRLVPDLGRVLSGISVPVRIPGPMTILLEIVPAVALIVGITLPVAYFFAQRPEGSPLPEIGTVAHPGGIGQPPKLVFQPPPGSRVSRLVDIRFTSDLYLDGVDVRLRPDPGVSCEATLDTGVTGRIRCAGPLPGGQDLVAEIRATSRYGGVLARADYAFRTVEKLDRLFGVKWFTQFEDPFAEPLACAAAAIRIVTNVTTAKDQMTADGILRMARPFNRSGDPGLDPVAIATALERLDPTSSYHYYVHPSREAATQAAVYWFVQSVKPVITITLGGQHAPVMIGYTGVFSDRYDDPGNQITGLIMMDPQRGDLDPLTARFRPDKTRSIDYQVGREVTLLEWYRDDWWFAAPYASAIPLPSGTALSIERTDGAYPLPHWAGSYVIIVDDGDADHPSDRMGRRAPGGP